MTLLQDTHQEGQNNIPQVSERHRLETLLKAIIPYLPQPIVERQLANPDVGSVLGEYWEGAVLFADLSGFTALSEILSRMGKQGAEVITSIVNDLFGALLEDAQRYRGILVKFGGDAMTVYFGGDDHTRRAARAGLAMQETMARRFVNLETPGGTFTLRLRVGIHTGRIFAAQVGYEPDYPLRGMELVVTGADINRVAEAQDYAAPGEVCITTETLTAIETQAEVQRVDGGMYRLESLTPSDPVEPPKQIATWSPSDEAPLSLLRLRLEALRPYLPVDLADERITDPSAPELRPDLRLVAVLFANFADLSAILALAASKGESGVSAATRILNLYYTLMQDIIGRYGGVVNKVDMYTHGDKLMAIFGAPLAHGDDAERAVRAALEMQAAMPRVNRYVKRVLEEAGVPFMPLTQRIGVNYGHVFAGNVGSERAGSRREYTVMGDTVNLAARLMSAAEEGGVLISPPVRRWVSDKFRLDDLSPIQVKGKAQPIPVSQPLRLLTEGERAELRRGRRPFIGRRAQLEAMRAATERTVSGLGQVVTVIGEAGTGKTRLMEAFQESLSDVSDTVGLKCYITELPSFAREPYAPIVDLLRRLIGLTGDSAGDAERLEDWVKARASELAHFLPLLGNLLTLSIPDNNITAALTTEQRRDRLFDLVEAILHNDARRRPLALVVDDLQWGDDSSLALLGRLTRNAPRAPLLLILCYRPDVTFPTPWAELAHTYALQVAEFGEEESAHLVAELLETPELPAGLAQMVWTRAQGNPFFTEEFVKSLRDTDALARVNSHWQLVGGEAALTAIPDTIEGIVLARLDRLGARAREVLQEAAVIATSWVRFDGSLLRRVDRQPELDERLRSLVHDGLLEELQLELEALEYHFRHTLTRDVAYDSLLYSRRRELHHLIAQATEALYADRLDEYLSSLAHHYFEAEEWPRAFEYVRRAGGRAQTLFANTDAIAHFGKALTIAEDHLPGMLVALDSDELGKALSDIHERLGDVQVLVGDYGEALRHYHVVRAMVEAEERSVGQMRHLADLCRKVAVVDERRSEYDAAFECLENGLRYLREDEPSIEAARIYLLGAGVYQRQGKNEEAIAWCQKSLDTATQIETREGQQAVAQANYNLGAIYMRHGDLRRAVQSCRESVRVYQQIDHIVGLSLAYLNLAVALSDQGDWDQASEAYHESLTMTQQIGDVLHQGMITNNLGNINLDRGHWIQAAKLFQQSTAIWKQLGAAFPEAVTLSNLAQVHIYQENWSEARACLSQSQAIFVEIGSDLYMPEVERRWGELYLRCGDLEQALAHTFRSIELAVAKEARLEEGQSLRVLGQVHQARGERASAEAALRKSLEILTELNSEYEAAKTRLRLVCLEIESEPTPAMRMMLEEAIGIFKKLGAEADLNEALALEKRL